MPQVSLVDPAVVEDDPPWSCDLKLIEGTSENAFSHSRLTGQMPYLLVVPYHVVDLSPLKWH